MGQIDDEHLAHLNSATPHGLAGQPAVPCNMHLLFLFSASDKVIKSIKLWSLCATMLEDKDICQH